MTVEPGVPSKGAVRRAGSTIRAVARGEDVPAEKALDAYDTVDAYRARFSEPTRRVATELASIVAELEMEAEVTHRIKRHVTIIDKLSREAGLDLSRMQDIGGCRVILQSREDLLRLRDHLDVTWGARAESKADYREQNYLDDPRESGYRAVHIIVRRDGYPVETQLRDPELHVWAETVEAFSLATRINYKQDGSSIVQDFMRRASEMLYRRETGDYISIAELDEMDTLRTSVQEFLDGLHPGDGATT